MESQQDLATALRELYKYFDSECRISDAQGRQAKEIKDYRASDRHHSYSRAMDKAKHKVLAVGAKHGISLTSITQDDLSTGQGD